MTSSSGLRLRTPLHQLDPAYKLAYTRLDRYLYSPGLLRNTSRRPLLPWMPRDRNRCVSNKRRSRNWDRVKTCSTHLDRKPETDRLIRRETERLIRRESYGNYAGGCM